jgi:fission process protein 1
MVPGAMINLIVKASRYAVRRSPMALPVMVVEWLPTASGLGSVPLIVQPIDHSIDYMLDNSTRLWSNQGN